ncbi:MAG: GNAT family N-acetyltransferase [Acidimicrobiales bacterium]
MVEVHDNPSELRFEIHDDGKLAGFAQYVRRPGRIFFVHTEIDPAFEGRGLGSQLAGAALDAVRATGEQVVPLCAFIVKYIDRHAEYGELVDHELMAQLEG